MTAATMKPPRTAPELLGSQSQSHPSPSSPRQPLARAHSDQSAQTLTSRPEKPNGWSRLLPSIGSLFRTVPHFVSDADCPDTLHTATTTAADPARSARSVYGHIARKLSYSTTKSTTSKISKTIKKAKTPPSKTSKTMPRAVSASAPAPAHVSLEPVKLSAWDQAAMRGYIRVCLCFPFDNARLDDAVAHLQASLARLAQQRPDFSGTLETRAGGILWLHPAPNEIPLLVEDISDKFPFASYADLKAAGFPPGAFVGPHFNQTCAMGEGLAPVPVSVIKAFVIPGGLILGTYFCHAFADGNCLKGFLECLSAQTCGQTVDVAANKILNVPYANDVCPVSDAALQALLAQTKEYALMDAPTGPTQPKMRVGGRPMEAIARTGKLFVFCNDKLDELREMVYRYAPDGTGDEDGPVATGILGILGNEHVNDGKQRDGASASASDSASNGSRESVVRRARKPSKYTCIAAATFRAIAKARLAEPAEHQHYPYEAGVDDTARLQTMVNWTGRAYAAANPAYYGNATAVAVTEVPTASAMLVGSDVATLAQLVYRIETTIAGVDEAYVRARTHMFSRASDPRRIGLLFDPRTPQDLGFNTWRFFGAETQWAIPGVADAADAADTEAPVRADVLRRMQDAWNMAGALIMPARNDSPVHELLITLPTTAMARLCADAEYMQWVDHVIG